jgi:uncharacterized protein (TIGR00304 family)
MRIDLMFMGIILVFIGFALLMLSASHVSYGGVIIVGPIPIVFGSSLDMIVIGIVLALILMIFTIVLMRW